MARKIALLVAMLLIPGAITAVIVLLLGRVLSRTPRGRRFMARFEGRMPAWLSAPLRSLQGKDLPLMGQAVS